MGLQQRKGNKMLAESESAEDNQEYIGRAARGIGTVLEESGERIRGFSRLLGKFGDATARR